VQRDVYMYVYITYVIFTGKSWGMLMQYEACVVLLFYKPPADDPFMNRVVAWLDGPYCHCEIAFIPAAAQQGGLQILASSIYADEPVFLKNRTFSNTQYDSITLTVKPWQVHKMLQFCRDAVERKQGFDTWGFYTCMLPGSGFFFQSGGRDVTFCSKFVAECLQHGDVCEFKSLMPTQCTPSALHRETLARGKGSMIFCPLKVRMQDLRCGD